MIAVVVDVDAEAVKLGFKKIAARKPEINRRILGVLGAAVVARADSGYLTGGHPLHRRSGLLAQSVTQSPKPGPGYIDVGSNVPYAAIHEYGGEIRPKKAKALRFVIGNRVIYAQKVTIPKRPFMAPAMADIFQSGKARTIIQSVLKKELKRCL